jgi:signal transduction histidine kinase
VTEAPGSPVDTEQAWAAWQLQRNARGLRSALYMALLLYPLFGVLDYLTAPKQWLWLLFSTRGLITLVTLIMFRVVKSPLFARRSNLISAGFMVLASLGISVMTVVMGGLASPYYAGLSLMTVGCGLLFVWPMQVVIPTHVTIVASFLLPNLLFLRRAEPLASLSNLFFLVSTAIIAGTGQVLAYASQRDQVANQSIIEGTREHLERANVELKKLDRFKSEFFANITHELKTPLTMVLTSLELLLDGELGHISEAQRSTFQSMQRSGAKLLRLIGDLLDLSRIEESRMRLRIAEHDLAAYVRDLVDEMRGLMQRKGITLSFESERSQLPVWCDLERLERVFLNLLSNASKFTDSGGSVSIHLKDDGDAVHVLVKDTGIGFPPELSKRIFYRFFQTDMGKTRRYGGTGIGLSLAKDLVELHGGKIWAESTPAGSLFHVRLLKDREHFSPDVLDRRGSAAAYADGKRTADRGVADWRFGAEAKFRFLEIDEVTEQRVVERDPDELRRSHTVLVVEDTPDVIRMIRLSLHHDFRVMAAINGAQGLELAKKHHPSIIVTDLMMPIMDGLELTERLRKDPQLCHIPIVMLTARNEVESRITGLQAGVDAYLGKPFSTKELVSTVRSLVRQQERTADLVLSQKMDSIETIAGGLAHEIGNPLNYVKNALQLVQKDTQQLMSAVAQDSKPGAEVDVAAMGRRTQKLFDVAEGGVRRIAATVDLMMRYSRNGFSRVHQAHDVYAAALEALNVLLPSLGKPLEIVTSFAGEPFVDCVPEELNQVLSNLIQNAAEAAPAEGGRLEIKGWNEDGWLFLSVRDNGTGISPENVNQVFNAFFTTKDAGAGMGLGLTIAQRVARALGGCIVVQSELGVGTVFTLRVPSLAPALQRKPHDEARAAEPLVPTRN